MTEMPEKTAIHRLALTDFRNYAAASLRFDGRHVVLTGDNGSGKTNLMEAVSFLSPGEASAARPIPMSCAMVRRPASRSSPQSKA